MIRSVSYGRVFQATGYRANRTVPLLPSVKDPWEKSSRTPLTRDLGSGYSARTLSKERGPPIVLPGNYSDNENREVEEDDFVMSRKGLLETRKVREGLNTLTCFNASHIENRPSHETHLDPTTHTANQALKFATLITDARGHSPLDVNIIVVPLTPDDSRAAIGLLGPQDL